MKKIHKDCVVDFTLSIPPDMMFRGERHDREERIGNLLDNGFKGARKTLHAEVKPHRKQAVRWCFCLDDDGPGLDKTQQQQVLQRGTCLDKTIPGSGLGLVIVCDLTRSRQFLFGAIPSGWRKGYPCLASCSLTLKPPSYRAGIKEQSPPYKEKINLSFGHRTT